MEINELIKECHENAVNKGFWEDVLLDKAHLKVTYLELKRYTDMHRTTLLALIITELGEAIEALRKDDEENHAEELADVLIRLCDYCGGYGVNLEKAVRDKMEINRGRPEKHGKSF